MHNEDEHTQQTQGNLQRVIEEFQARGPKAKPPTLADFIREQGYSNEPQNRR